MDGWRDRSMDAAVGRHRLGVGKGAEKTVQISAPVIV